MTTGKSVALGTALLMGIALAVAGPAPAAQFDQRTFDVPADRLFQLVLAAAEGRFELKRVNEPIRVVAEAREISSGAKLALEVDAAGETAARVRITAGNQSEKSRAAMRAMLGELERRVQEQHQFATVGSTTSVTPDQVRQITEWTHSYPPNVDQYRTGRYDVPIKHGSSKTTVRTLLTVLTPYLRVALSAHGASASLKALSPDSLSAETLAPLVQVLAEPYDKGPSFHPVFRYLTADHMVILPPGSRDASQAIQPAWSDVRVSEWPAVADPRAGKVLVAAFRPADIRPGAVFVVVYRDATTGERKDVRIPITARHLLYWNLQSS